jgi:hypothetical protein
MSELDQSFGRLRQPRALAFDIERLEAADGDLHCW